MTKGRLLPFDHLSFGAAALRRGSPVDFRGSEASCIDIGLVNNMPDTALEATERQFRSLLDEAGHGMVVRLTLYALPDVPRSDAGRQHVSRFYSGIDALSDARLDGLIVTGAEPRTPNLRDEPFWGSLARVLEWADAHTYSSVWSCLAAHAAVLHLDGIGRRRLSDKRFGVFEYTRASDHPLAATIPSRLQMPHSRWNDLAEDELLACGYDVLTRSDAAGVDAFVKQRQSLFVFFQGHPEYDADTLLLEYRRDIKRFLRHERDTYPAPPHGYFGGDENAALTALRERAQSDRREEIIADFPADMAGRVANAWRPGALSIYRDWLLHLCALKEQRLTASSFEVSAT